MDREIVCPNCGKPLESCRTGDLEVYGEDDDINIGRLHIMICFKCSYIDEQTMYLA